MCTREDVGISNLRSVRTSRVVRSKANRKKGLVSDLNGHKLDLEGGVILFTCGGSTFKRSDLENIQGATDS